MRTRVSDLHIEENIPLPAPALLRSQIGRSEEQAQFIVAARRTVASILFGDDPRFMVVVGPCSIHDPEAGLDYAERLAQLAQRVQDEIYVVMRVYFEKPRTTVGWKGLIMDPQLDGSYDIPAGLRTARSLLRDIIGMGLPTATEFLDPITPQYIADLICWSAIGARTSESQTHRQMASGLSMPVGFKNNTAGQIVSAINGVKASSKPQTFLGVSEQGVASAVSTTGNKYCHIVLRGGSNGPNYNAETVAKVQQQLRDAGLPPVVMIDASHANCGKDDQCMPQVFRDIVEQRAAGNQGIIGAMLESNLVAGNQPFPQPLEKLVRGQSITDKCLSWETTEELLLEAAATLRPLVHR